VTANDAIAELLKHILLIIKLFLYVKAAAKLLDGALKVEPTTNAAYAIAEARLT
jgi:predicted Co/Zn/Cd cation transporter (cation efflux family)